MKDKGPCTTCRGAYSEHFDLEGRQLTQHPYTSEGHNLTTKREREKERQAQQQPQLRMTLPSAGSDSATIGRLVEVLIDKGVLTVEDGLYIAGMGKKQSTPSGYRDPASLREG